MLSHTGNIEVSNEQDRADVKFFPPGIPLFTILASVAADQLWPLKLDFLPDTPIRYWIGGIIVGLSFACLGFWSVKTMRQSGQSENPYKPTTSILDSGPFAITRNPMYLQMVLVCFGLGIAFGNAWLLILTPVCAALLQILVIRPEEEYLEHKFGQPYRDYKNRVRRWL